MERKKLEFALACSRNRRTARSDTVAPVAVNQADRTSSSGYQIGTTNVCVNPGETTDGVLLAVPPTLKDNKELRIVLTWAKKPVDMDIHFQFVTNQFCDVSSVSKFVGLGTCDTATLESETFNGGDKGCESVYIANLKSTKYLLNVYRYSNSDQTSIYNSKAKIDLYAGTSLYPLWSWTVPGRDLTGTDRNQAFRWWNVLCIDGSKDLNKGIIPLNSFTAESPSVGEACGV